MNPLTFSHRDYLIIPYCRLGLCNVPQLGERVGYWNGRNWVGHLMRRLVGLTVWFLTFSCASVLGQEISGEVAPGSTKSSIDCSEVTIDYVEDPTLTREEKIAVMDEALSRSLSKFEFCETSRQRSGSGNAAAGLSSDGGTGAEGNVNSQGSPDITGTESPMAADELGAASDGLAQGVSDGNGKVPSDIPSIDNDSVLEAQIRRAAMNESNPEVREKLWNEYRRYKGLEEPDEESAEQGGEKETQEVVPSGGRKAEDNSPNFEKGNLEPSPLATGASEDITSSPATDRTQKMVPKTMGNGKVPDDIPPADNDSLLESQIREAAMKESDPEARENLWEAYRRYKRRDELFVE